jgi:phosphonatase-like hydrolase
MSIKLVVFDIAGTTVRDECKVSEAFRSSLEKYGFSVPASELGPFMGYEKNRAIRDILKKFHHEGAIDDGLITLIHEDFTANMIQYYKTSDEIEPLPNVEKTFRLLHDAGKMVAINTGFSRDIADAIVNKLKWWENGLIDFLVASDEVAQGRPYPDMIQAIMQQAGIEDPKEIAKVGDTEVDINEGRNAGCSYAIGITTGSYTRVQLEEHHPTHIIDDIMEVIAIVNR